MPQKDQKLIPDSKELGMFGKLVLHKKRDLIINIWHDLKPQDNNIVLEFK